ncbi:Putative pentatricopeptide repeat-containing protein At1g68930 [Linum perenne]
MQRNEIMPDDITLGSVISSCANLSSLEEGVQFHAQALMSGLISFISVSNALITLYGKCGSVEECENKLYIFSADDFSSPFYDQIYAELEKLNEKMIQMGYVPDPSSVLHDVEESEKIKMLGHHSEKLAIAFGLIFIPRSCPIRVVKNLRVCRDCHTVTKYISKITQREILVRDCPVPFV